ncbi:MAG: hypothetical protein F6K58_00430 [Symploca sp. SIO2E9]|nr:hypothetical protein [Symploca sp. SIO2E9]
MITNWRTYIVSELEKAGLLRVEDGNHGEYRPRRDEFIESGTPFIRAADMDKGIILFESASRINQTALSRIRKGIGNPGDTLFSSKGTVGKVALAPLDCEPFVCSPQVTFWRSLDHNFLDYRFLCYYIQSSDFWNQVTSRSGETDMAPYISLTNQREFKIAIPPLPEQKTIANILGTLDDKIELNQQMNRTLEAIAQAIFKSWFVNFDPVYAKMEGRQPVGMDAATAALFPDEFEDSPLGKIPKGWKVMQLKEIANNESETFDFLSHSEVIFLNTGDLALGKFLHANYSQKDVLPGQAKKAIKKDDILMSEIRPANGRYAFVNFTPDDYVVSTKFMVIRAYSAIEPIVLYRMLTSLEVLSNLQVIAETRSGTFPQVTFKSISHLSFVVPPKSIQLLYKKTVDKLDKKIRFNDSESKTLISIRDTLLPKLLSGEIRVKEAENLVETVT